MRRSWYWRVDLEGTQAAAARMGHPVLVESPGELRGYRPTEGWQTNPAGHGDGRVWAWIPELVGHQAERSGPGALSEALDGSVQRGPGTQEPRSAHVYSS